MQWIDSWLGGRSQRVVLNGQESEWLEVLSGVLQGSVLGPMAFLVFINDIDESATLIDLILKFADDTKLSNQATLPTDQQNMQTTLDNLVRWAEDWGMLFNIQKCKVMHIGAKNPSFKYNMNGIDLEVVREEKDVGVVTTDSLKFRRHCEEAVRRANAVLTQISRSFHYRDRHTFRKLYVQYVRPHLEYASPVWNPHNRQEVDLLERVQRRAVNMISGLRESSYEGKLRELGLDSLELRRKKLDLTQTYKILTGKDNVNARTWFLTQEAARTRITRQTEFGLNIVRERISKTDTRNYTFSQRMINQWNELPVDVKTARNTSSFKNKLNYYFKEQEQQL